MTVDRQVLLTGGSGGFFLVFFIERNSRFLSRNFFFICPEDILQMSLWMPLICITVVFSALVDSSCL